MVDFDKMRSDADIASQVKSIYIKSQNLDQETLSDHWVLDYGEFLKLLFEDEVLPTKLTKGDSN